MVRYQIIHSETVPVHTLSRETAVKEIMEFLPARDKETVVFNSQDKEEAINELSKYRSSCSGRKTPTGAEWTLELYELEEQMLSADEDIDEITIIDTALFDDTHVSIEE